MLFNFQGASAVFARFFCFSLPARDSLVIIPCPKGNVNTFFQVFLIFSEKSFSTPFLPLFIPIYNISAITCPFWPSKRGPALSKFLFSYKLPSGKKSLKAAFFFPFHPVTVQAAARELSTASSVASPTARNARSIFPSLRIF